MERVMLVGGCGSVFTCRLSLTVSLSFLFLSFPSSLSSYPFHPLLLSPLFFLSSLFPQDPLLGRRRIIDE